MDRDVEEELKRSPDIATQQEHRRPARDAVTLPPSQANRNARPRRAADRVTHVRIRVDRANGEAS